MSTSPLPAQGPLVRSSLHEPGILTLTLDAPANRNALSDAMIGALQEALEAASVDPNVRVVILAANGPAFCAGHDLKELTRARAEADHGRRHFTGTMTACAKLMTTIVRLPKPVIARVHALATAAGCQLVASCDLAVASTKAGFCTPGVNIGLFCSTPMVALSRNVARKHAMEMLLTGRVVPAEEALRIGLINKIVPEEDLERAAHEMALVIARKSAHTVRIGKEAFYQQLEMGLEEAYCLAAEVMVENMLAHDAEEGICAFIEKRHPHWADR